MINRFIPERTPEELRQRLRQLEHSGSKFTVRIPNMTKLSWLITGGVLAIAVAGFTWFALKPNPSPKHPAASLGQSILAQVSGFKPYYLKPSFSTDFSLQPETVTYQSGVLEFSMQNPSKQSLAFTEEQIPPGFDTSSLKADSVYNNEYGHAYISDLVDRTTGALFTRDGTWILINAPTPIGSSTMKSIVDNLAPTNN